MWTRGIDFDMLEVLGEGGQGRVFKALRRDRETGLCETVALKVLHSETAVSLWKQEFESLRRVRSPYCVQVLSFDRVRGRPALVLEFVDGVPLTQLGRSCVLDGGDVGEILAQIEAGLRDLHAIGIFHGDLSPANVLVDRSGAVKLLDFGLANGGERLTPEFAAPERLSGAPPGFATDLYSLGAIESFLLGRKLTEKECPAYFAADPSLRRLRGLTSGSAARKNLAAKIELWQQRSSWARRCKTKTLQVVKGAPGRLRSFTLTAAMLVCLFTASSARSYNVPRHPFAILIVRTLKWHNLHLNGRAIGYSPVTITLPAGQDAVLSWTSAHGGGRKALRAFPGQRIVMDDSDLKRQGGPDESASRASQNSGNSGR